MAGKRTSEAEIERLNALRERTGRNSIPAEERVALCIRKMNELGADTTALRAKLDKHCDPKARAGIASAALAKADGRWKAMYSDPHHQHPWRCQATARGTGQQCRRVVELAQREFGIMRCKFHGGAWLLAIRRNRR